MLFPKLFYSSLYECANFNFITPNEAVAKFINTDYILLHKRVQLLIRKKYPAVFGANFTHFKNV